MTKVRELREMAEDQIRAVWKDAAESLFRLRLQAQTEKLAAPTEVKKHRRTIARCQTILAERGLLRSDEAKGPAQGEHSPQHEKHARKRRASGRGKIRAEKTGRVAGKRQHQKRSQSGS